MSAVIATGVSKRYGATLALDSLDLEIERGEVFGLLGPNGSGKTTFIRLLAGYLLPTSGRLEVEGRDSVRQSLQTRALIGYVPEAAPVYGNMRVREFLAFMARLRGVSTRQVGPAVDRAVEALIHDPPIVILDEPTNGLDPRQIIEIRELIRGLAGRHTVIVSSHILSEVARVADRVGILLGGKLLGVRTMADTPDLEAWFLSVA